MKVKKVIKIQRHHRAGHTSRHGNKLLIYFAVYLKYLIFAEKLEKYLFNPISKMMKIVILDGYTANPGDLSWEELEKLGEVTVYDRTIQ